MTYRLPRTLPYLAALLSAALVAAMFLAPDQHGPVTPLAYMLVGGFAAVILGWGILSQRYSVTVGTDRLLISGIHRKEYRFIDMANLEVLPGAKGVRVAVVTMKDGTRVNVSSSLRDFEGFVSTLGTSAQLPVPASNNRWRGP